MSTYAAIRAATGGVQSVGVIAVTYPLRLVRTETIGGSGGYFNVHRYSGAGLSGGTALTPMVMRQGLAPASSATAKYGSTITGTGSVLYSTPTVSTGTQFQPPFELIVAPGSAVFLNESADAGSATLGGSIQATYLAIFFEELRRNWSG